MKHRVTAPTSFYNLSSEILALYLPKLLALPRIPMEQAMRKFKGVGGIYLMFNRKGKLFNVGKAVDFKARFSLYSSNWRPNSRRIIRSTTVALVSFPLEPEWPRMQWKRALYRLEWFIQLALVIPSRMNNIYRADVNLFHNDRPQVDW